MSSIRPVVRGMRCWTDDSCSIKVNLSSCLYCEKAFPTSVLARWPTSCFRLRSKHINAAGMCGHRVPVWKRSLEPWVTLLTDLTWYWRGCECMCRRGRERYNYLLVLFFLSFCQQCFLHLNDKPQLSSLITLSRSIISLLSRGGIHRIPELRLRYCRF